MVIYLLYFLIKYVTLEVGVYYINSSAWVLRCSFNYTGQCESLEAWDG